MVPTGTELSVSARHLRNAFLSSPGGPYRSTPLAGALSPVNRSGRRLGRMTVSCNVCLAYSNPAIESHVTPGELSYNVPGGRHSETSRSFKSPSIQRRHADDGVGPTPEKQDRLRSPF